MLYQILSIIILLTFYGCYFFKMINQKQKGITTDQIGKGKVGTIKVIEITMKVASYFTPFFEVISIFLGTTGFPDWVRIFGVCVGFLGVIIFIISVVTMRDNWRAGVSKTDKTNLVTDGIYQISRNPAFLGFDLVYIGILFVFFNWVLFVTSAFTIIMFHLQIVNVEESFLLSEFGEEYIEYKKKVCRYIGRR
ncbi:MAG: isoprenylcysteine carboxylmethyltransferase family protein [Ruminococcus sp.]|nr:isoprenylcysteine carboxylmethyltransferase family protein [Ruminococcus sp.]